MTVGGVMRNPLSRSTPQSWRQDARSKGIMSTVEGLDDKSDGGLPDPSSHRRHAWSLAWMPDRSFSLQAWGPFTAPPRFPATYPKTR